MKSASLCTALVLSLGIFATHAAQAQGLFDFFEQFQQPRPRPQYYPQQQDPRYYPQPQLPQYRRPQYPTNITPYGTNDDLQDGAEGAGDKDKRAYSEFSSQPNIDLPMYITSPEWNQQTELSFGKFVNSIGKGIKSGACNTVKNCMKNPEVNPYADTDPEELILYSDCADFPYFLRAYFAYKNGLPFSYVTGVEMLQAPVASNADRQDDLLTARLDNSPYGNQIKSRGGSNIPSQPGQEKNFVRYIKTMFDIVSTRTFRTGPLTPNAQMSDVYPVKMNRVGISAGSVVHTTGHLYTVYDVDNLGTIHMIDAHPDGSVSYKVLKSSTLDRSRPDHGLGIYKFRPLKLVGAQRYSNGTYYGGKITLVSNEELIRQGLYSLEQWYGSNTTVVPGTLIDPNAYKSAFKQIGFFDQLKLNLRDRNVLNPADQELADLMDSLCTEMKQRVDDVDKAINAGGPGLAHPTELPQNIYSTSGFWEDYSSPGRDSRMKSSVLDIARAAVMKFKQAKTGGYGIGFAGSAQDYQKAVLGRLAALDKSCQVTYKKSNGAKQVLTFNQIVARLNKLSLDPYHCAERRWGASGQELATCKDQDAGGVWYAAEQPIRNTVGKTTAGEKLIVRATQPITIEMLKDASLIDQDDSADTNLGVSKAPFTDLKGYFSSETFIQHLTGGGQAQ